MYDFYKIKHKNFRLKSKFCCRYIAYLLQQQT